MIYCDYKIYTKEVFNMLIFLDENNSQNYKFTIDETKLNNILDTAIANDSSLIVGKLPVEEPLYNTLSMDEPKKKDEKESSILALTVRPKESFLKGLRISIKVAVSTFFIQLARIFI